MDAAETILGDYTRRTYFRFARDSIGTTKHCRLQKSFSVTATYLSVRIVMAFASLPVFRGGRSPFESIQIAALIDSI
jgi:hypothetical protein